MKADCTDIETSFKYGLVFSSAGCMPPLSYHGDRNARQPIGEMIFPYFFVHAGNIAFSCKGKPVRYMVLLEQSMPASNTSSNSPPGPCSFHHKEIRSSGTVPVFLWHAFPCPPFRTFNMVMVAIFAKRLVPVPAVIVING